MAKKKPTQEKPKIKPQPLDNVNWVPRDSIAPNNYNPNKMPKIEFKLLKISILADGWTQPIVVSGSTIVDGEHRWTVAADPEVAALTGGLVPIVRVSADLSHRMMSTVRHNRARGNHLVLPMGEIVRSLLESGIAKEAVMDLMQMEEEEVDRLAERAGMPEQVARSSNGFKKGWQPG